jgi:hypothetical protein
VGNPSSGIPAPDYVTNGPGAINVFNPAAFVAAAPGTFGTEKRNFLRGPGLTVFNLSLAKNVHFGERIALEIRGDFVNAFNHPSFGIPNTSFGGADFGVLNSGDSNAIAVQPRSGQLSAHISF